MADAPSLYDFLAQFPDDQACWNHLREARWGTGFECPRCRETERWSFIKTRKLFQCNACKYQASVTSGTILQDTKLPLHKWFLAAFFILTTKKGLSTHELARKVGVHQETAWFLHNKLVSVVQTRVGRELFGLVETDETYVGGKRGSVGRRTSKATVVGMVESHEQGAGNLHLVHVENASGAELQPAVRAHVRPGSTVKTDGWQAYWGLDGEYDLDNKTQPSRAQAKEHLPWIHIVFSNLKRVMGGVHTKATREKVQSFLDLFSYRFNHRSDLGRGLEAVLVGFVQAPVLRYEDIKGSGGEFAYY